jgi:hypothetical protein
MPVVAGAYVLGMAVLIGLGAGASFSVGEAWANGYLIASMSAVYFAFSTQINRWLDRLTEVN